MKKLLYFASGRTTSRVLGMGALYASKMWTVQMMPLARQYCRLATSTCASLQEICYHKEGVKSLQLSTLLRIERKTFLLLWET